MALSDLWSRQTLRAAVRRELNDVKGNLSWSWTDAELNQYLQDGMDFLQDRFEFAWGSSTVNAVSTATLTLTNVAPNILRFDSVWFNSYRLAGRDKTELEMSIRDWRAVKPSSPTVVYQDDTATVSFFPPPDPTVTNTAIFEYPRRLTFIDDTTPMGVPAWTKYGLVAYAAWRAMLRPGPSQDLQKASQYEAKFRYQLKRYRTIQDSHLPAKAPSLRPGGKYEGDILTMGVGNHLFQSWF